MHLTLSWATLTLGAWTLLGQPLTSTRRATITGRGGDGKCTIEVEVDGSAEVEVSGDVGLLRTLSGQPAAWRRFECNGPLPRNPGEFRFRGIDGRGQVALVRDPRGSRGRAVVRIDDPKGGREGYTFDLEWRGSSSGFWSSPEPILRGGGPSPAAQAIRVCQDAVTARIERDGYRYIHFESTQPDNNPGRDDWILGSVTGQRGRNTTRFSFACSVDFNTGRVRSVDVRRH